MHWHPSTGATFVVVCALLGGCGNPTADKPAAKVTEPPLQKTSTPPAALGESPPIEGTVYQFTENSGIDFEGFKVTASHVGGFGSIEGEITVPDGDLTAAHIRIDIDMTSIYSDDPGLTKKLKSADFFEVETYPRSTFRSSGVTATAEGYDVTGDLTMHGVTKRITFPAAIDLAGDTLTAEAEFTINRFDWNIRYKGLADDLIRDDVLMVFEIEARATKN